MQCPWLRPQRFDYNAVSKPIEYEECLEAQASISCFRKDMGCVGPHTGIFYGHTSSYFWVLFSSFLLHTVNTVILLGRGKILYTASHIDNTDKSNIRFFRRLYGVKKIQAYLCKLPVVTLSHVNLISHEFFLIY